MTAKIMSSQDISLRMQNIAEKVVIEGIIALVNSGRELKLVPQENGDVMLQVRAKEV